MLSACRGSRAAGAALAASLGWAVLWGAHASAQPLGVGSETEQPAVQQVSDDPLGRETPRGMTHGLIEALAAEDIARAAQFLDLSTISEERRNWAGRRAAGTLQRVLDRRGAIFPTYRLGTTPEGMTDDQLPAGVDAFATVRAEGTTLLNLTAHRVAQNDGSLIWLVTPESLDVAQSLSALAAPALVDRLSPDGWSEIRMSGVSATHWVAAAVIAVLSLIVARAVASGLLFAAVLAPPMRSAERRHVARCVLLPTGVLLATVLFSVATGLAGVSVVARSLLSPYVEIVAWLAIAWLAWRMIDGLATAGLNSMSRRGRIGAISVMTMARRATKIVIFGVAAIAIFSSLGVNLTGWLAAFGLGGLALALGAQKTIEHFVGSLTIIADQPVRIGDFCQVDGLLGTVEDIGMRSTRLRTLERTLVTIPNGAMSTARIENYASRDRFLFKTVVSVTNDTSPDQMRQLLWRLRGILEHDDRVTDDPARVRFLSFGTSSLDIEIFAYVLAADYNAFLAVREELNLQIMECVAATGTSFAFPSHSVYIRSRGDAAQPPQLAAAAE